LYTCPIGETSEKHLLAEKKIILVVILFLHNHADFKNFRFAIADAILTSELRTSQQ